MYFNFVAMIFIQYSCTGKKYYCVQLLTMEFALFEDQGCSILFQSFTENLVKFFTLHSYTCLHN